MTAADCGNQTGLLPRSATGAVPSGARQVRLLLTQTRSSGSSNDGYADNLSLVLKRA